MHLHVGEAKLAQISGAQLDHLEINPWATITDRLNIELRELAVAPLLWTVVAKELGNGGKAYGLRLRAHTVLDVGSDGARRCFRAKRQGDRIVTPRLQPIELLRDDV